MYLHLGAGRIWVEREGSDIVSKRPHPTRMALLITHLLSSESSTVSLLSHTLLRAHTVQQACLRPWAITHDSPLKLTAAAPGHVLSQLVAMAAVQRSHPNSTEIQIFAVMLTNRQHG